MIGELRRLHRHIWIAWLVVVAAAAAKDVVSRKVGEKDKTGEREGLGHRADGARQVHDGGAAGRTRRPTAHRGHHDADAH